MQVTLSGGEHGGTVVEASVGETIEIADESGVHKYEVREYDNGKSTYFVGVFVGFERKR